MLMGQKFRRLSDGMKIKVLEFFDSKNESMNCPGRGEAMNGMLCLDIEKNIKFKISTRNQLTQFWPAFKGSAYIGMYRRFIPID